MHVLYSGFDGLDLAIKTHAPPRLVEELEAGKAFASEYQCDARTVFNGVKLYIGGSGRRGGYAYTFHTGPEGAIWAVKKPKASDPWGIHVSIRSRALALHGLEKVRQDLEATCDKLGFRITPDGISVSRVDYAIDILDPDFTLDPNSFVVHSRMKLKTHADLAEVSIHSHSGRVTSVTLGKMPGRQVIVYDKREEVLQKHKHEWPLIWNEAAKRLGLAPLDTTQRENSQVWRVELRLGKTALRNRTSIRGWVSFYEELEAEMIKLAEDVSLHVPTADTNRARWPWHPLWTTVAGATKQGLFAHEVRVAPEFVHDADLKQKQLEFLNLVAAHSVTLAYLEGVTEADVPEFLENMPGRVEFFLEQHRRDLGTRLSEAAEKYGVLVGD
ncbi:hypothetical protein [Gymnodinialimonas hymeniacidonis]|uniref:hypothetical protein n=1 Tax=Gymnodinialimonas hymeniacidonis TaxID=3126508 RepID=UPI0034C62813